MMKSNYQNILTDINASMKHATRSQSQLLNKLTQLEQRYGDLFYPAIFEVLTYTHFKTAEAKKHWQKVIDHLTVLEKNCKREVGIRVAILDYFTNVNKRLKNPILIEIALFKQTQVNAMTDPLTTLFNRRYFTEVIKREFERARRYKSPISLIFFDIDNFKSYNDYNGHIEGDVLLKRVSDIMKKAIRQPDIACRYGGEEFVIICPETRKQNALVVAERIRKTIEKEKFKGERKSQPSGTVTISGGISSFPVDANSIQSLIATADDALYRAKLAQKNSIALFYREKRNFIRMKKELFIDFREVSDGYINRKLGQTKNISEGGILFTATQPVRVGSELEITIKHPQEKKRRADFLARVVRVEEMENELYEIAICFLGLTEKKQNKLKAFIKTK